MAPGLGKLIFALSIKDLSPQEKKKKRRGL
jgi:hypothetical protein